MTCDEEGLDDHKDWNDDEEEAGCQIGGVDDDVASLLCDDCDQVYGATSSASS